MDSAFEEEPVQNQQKGNGEADRTEVALLDALNDATLSLDGIIRLLDGLANHDETNRKESLALIVVTERMQDITDNLRKEAHMLNCRILNSN